MPDLRGLGIEALERFAATLGERPFRGRQLGRWIHLKGAGSVEEMTDLSARLREKLKDACTITTLEKDEDVRSSDGSRRLRLKTACGDFVESVLIPDQGRLTLCVSTQVGCAMGCRFCLTGIAGFRRNLSCAEIIGQVVAARKALSARERITNVVLMGMGEPLHNYENTVSALRLITDPRLHGFSRRRVTVSTAGLIPQMLRLCREVPVRIAVSLNASNDQVRSWLMPLNARYPLPELLSACRHLRLEPRSRITFEYVMINEVNDRIEHAAELAAKLSRIRCKVNLIALNPVKGISFMPPDRTGMEAFQQHLFRRGIAAFIRESRGSDVGAACGQLTFQR